MGLAVDLLVALLLLWSIVRGWQNGFLYQLGHLAGLIVSYFAARALSSSFEKTVATTLGTSPLITAAVTFFLLFAVLAFILAILVKKMTRDLIPEASSISTVNRALGAGVSFAKGGLIAFVLLVLLLQFVAIDKKDHPLGSSVTASWVAKNQDFIATGRLGTLAKLAWIIGNRDPIELANDSRLQSLAAHPKGAILRSPEVLLAVARQDFVALLKNEQLWEFIDDEEVRRMVASWPWTDGGESSKPRGG
jgi:uncharacterized membrane protein required for colicin V production